MAYNHVQRGGVEFHWASVSDVALGVTVTVPHRWQQQLNVSIPVGPPTELLARPTSKLKTLPQAT